MKLLEREIARARIVMYERVSNLYVPVQRFLPFPPRNPFAIAMLHFNTHRVLLYSSAYNSNVRCHSNE
jgi:hypothetical protein